MLTVRLHGHLEEKYGSEFRFEAKTVREVIDALQANFDDFTEEFIKDQRAYNILVDAEAQNLEGCSLPIKTDSTIDIIPVIGGAGFLKAIGLILLGALLLFPPFAIAVGTALVGLGVPGAAFGYIVAGIQAIGWGLALGGVASLLAGPDGPDGGGEKSSTLSQTDNIVGQGMPIPVGYGRLMLGSFVISATSTSSYSLVSNAWTYENTQTDTTEDHVINVGPAEDVAGGTVRDDGYVVSATIYPGFTPERLTEIISVNEVNLGNGTYEVVNQTTSSGITIATPIFKPRQVAGSYDGDAAINHR